MEDLKLFTENVENKPIIERTHDHLMIRNVPACACYREIMNGYFINCGICESEKGARMLNSGICLIKIKKDDNFYGCNKKFSKRNPAY